MKLGIIGGSGLDQIEEITNISKQIIKTPFGDPSDEFTCGTLHGRESYSSRGTAKDTI